MINANQIIQGAEAREESRGAHSREDFKDRMDELDYAKPLEGQTPIPMEQHWRKHTLAFTNGATGETQLKYRSTIFNIFAEQFVMSCFFSGLLLITRWMLRSVRQFRLQSEATRDLSQQDSKEQDPSQVC